MKFEEAEGSIHQVKEYILIKYSRHIVYVFNNKKEYLKELSEVFIQYTIDKVYWDIEHMFEKFKSSDEYNKCMHNINFASKLDNIVD